MAAAFNSALISPSRDPRSTAFSARRPCARPALARASESPSASLPSTRSPLSRQTSTLAAERPGARASKLTSHVLPSTRGCGLLLANTSKCESSSGNSCDKARSRKACQRPLLCRRFWARLRRSTCRRPIKPSKFAGPKDKSFPARLSDAGADSRNKGVASTARRLLRLSSASVPRHDKAGEVSDRPLLPDNKPPSRARRKTRFSGKPSVPAR